MKTLIRNFEVTPQRDDLNKYAAVTLFATKNPEGFELLVETADGFENSTFLREKLAVRAFNEQVARFSESPNEILDFIFDARDIELSCNPSLSAATTEGLYYIVFEEKFHAGFIALDDKMGGEEESFETFAEAAKSLNDRFAVEIKHGREKMNFWAFVNK